MPIRPSEHSLPAVMTLILAVVSSGCDSPTGLFSDEPEHLAYTDMGYPFTAYLDPADSVQLFSGEWIEAPRPDWLQPATQRAIERWSRALAATAPREWIVPDGFAMSWAPDILPGDTLVGFHIGVSFAGCLGYVGLSYGSVKDTTDGRPVIGSFCISPTIDFSLQGAETVIAHEMGHVLGFTSLTYPDSLLAFVNEHARTMTGLDVDVADRVPMHGSHWLPCMEPDLMTASAHADRGSTAHISAITIEAMRFSASPYTWSYRQNDVEEALPSTPVECWRD